MSHKLAESFAVGACRRLGRQTSPSFRRGLRSYYHASSTSTSINPVRITSSRIRPATSASLSPHFDRVVRDDQHRRRFSEGGGGAAPQPKSAEDGGDVAPFASPKVEALFQRMIALDMVEVHLLAEMINEKMGITISDAERERMARGGGGGGGKKKGGDEEEAAEAAVEKTAFDLKLTGFDAKSKIKVIKEVRAMTSLGLKEAKELVEGAPTTVKKDIKKEEAEELKGKLEALGAQVEIV